MLGLNLELFHECSFVKRYLRHLNPERNVEGCWKDNFEWCLQKEIENNNKSRNLEDLHLKVTLLSILDVKNNPKSS